MFITAVWGTLPKAGSHGPQSDILKHNQPFCPRSRCSRSRQGLMLGVTQSTYGSPRCVATAPTDRPIPAGPTEWARETPGGRSEPLHVLQTQWVLSPQGGKLKGHHLQSPPTPPKASSRNQDKMRGQRGRERTPNTRPSSTGIAWGLGTAGVSTEASLRHSRPWTHLGAIT